MNLEKYAKKLVGNEDERAVSPVIGVVLMVAITVILAAVIAAFVMDMGDDMGESAPTANFDWDEDSDLENGEGVVTHSGGDTLNSDDITIVVVSGDDDVSDEDVDDGDWGDDDEISSGDRFTGLDEDSEYSIVWESGSDSSTLDTHDFSE